jgi:hypothetical protein
VRISFHIDSQAGLATINILAGKNTGAVNILSLEPRPGDTVSYEVSIARGAFKGARTIVVQTVTDDGKTYSSAPATF